MLPVSGEQSCSGLWTEGVVKRSRLLWGTPPPNMYEIVLSLMRGSHSLEDHRDIKCLGPSHSLSLKSLPRARCLGRPGQSGHLENLAKAAMMAEKRCPSVLPKKPMYQAYDARPRHNRVDHFSLADANTKLWSALPDACWRAWDESARSEFRLCTTPVTRATLEEISLGASAECHRGQRVICTLMLRGKLITF